VSESFDRLVTVVQEPDRKPGLDVDIGIDHEGLVELLQGGDRIVMSVDQAWNLQTALAALLPLPGRFAA
jgi:hypothetical protein